MKKVLFVCVGNTCRSQMAEGFARRYGAGLIEVESAGLAPTPNLAADTVAVMQEREVDIRAQFPKAFELEFARRSDYIFNMSGYELPPVPGPVVIEWEVEDPFCQNLEVYRRVRDQIEAGVTKIVQEIRAGNIPDRATIGQQIAPFELRKPGLWQRFTRWR